MSQMLITKNENKGEDSRIFTVEWLLTSPGIGNSPPEPKRRDIHSKRKLVGFGSLSYWEEQNWVTFSSRKIEK